VVFETRAVNGRTRRLAFAATLWITSVDSRP
jgi:hypothetical protein